MVRLISKIDSRATSHGRYKSLGVLQLALVPRASLGRFTGFFPLSVGRALIVQGIWVRKGSYRVLLFVLFLSAHAYCILVVLCFFQGCSLHVLCYLIFYYG